MTSLSKMLLALAFSALANTTVAAPKGNAAAGAIAAKPCAACHGPTGDESLDAQYPKLAGQYPDYLLRSLQEYQSGRRDNAIMAGFVKDLSPQDLADLAAFYAAQDGSLKDLSHLK